MLLLPTMALAVFTSITVLVALWEWTRMAGIHLAAGAFGRRSRSSRSRLFALWLLRDEPLIWYVIAAGGAWWIVAFLWLRNFSFGAAPTRENAAIKFVARTLGDVAGVGRAQQAACRSAQRSGLGAARR